jgi:hypothetical protein
VSVRLVEGPGQTTKAKQSVIISAAKNRAGIRIQTTVQQESNLRPVSGGCMPVKKKRLGKTGAPLSTAQRIRLIQECAGLSASQKSVLGLLGMLYNEAEGFSLASINLMSYRLSLNPSTVKRCLSALKQENLIERSLCKGDWTVIRKTMIFWNNLHTRRVRFPNATVPVQTKIIKGDVGPWG